MGEMRITGGWLGVLLIAMILAACVPDPTNRVQPGATPTPSPTPVPTPAGPTPTLFSYKVVSGDSLEKIAKKFKTSARSISYWNRATYPSLDPESGSYRPDYLKLGWVLVLIPNAEVDPENLPTLPPG